MLCLVLANQHFLLIKNYFVWNSTKVAPTKITFIAYNRRLSYQYKPTLVTYSLSHGQILA